MKVVIDSNVFVTCLNSFSPYHKVFQSLVKGQYKIVISTEIAFEYREVFSVKFPKQKSVLFLGILETLKNVVEVKIFFR